MQRMCAHSAYARKRWAAWGGMDRIGNYGVRRSSSSHSQSLTGRPTSRVRLPSAALRLPIPCAASLRLVHSAHSTTPPLHRDPTASSCSPTSTLLVADAWGCDVTALRPRLHTRPLCPRSPLEPACESIHSFSLLPSSSHSSFPHRCHAYSFPSSMSAPYKAVVGGQLKLKRKGGPTVSNAATAAPPTKPRTPLHCILPPSSSLVFFSLPLVALLRHCARLFQRSRRFEAVEDGDGHERRFLRSRLRFHRPDRRRWSNEGGEGLRSCAGQESPHHSTAAIHPSGGAEEGRSRSADSLSSPLPCCPCALLCAGGGVDRAEDPEDAPAVHRGVQRQAGGAERAPRHPPSGAGVSR